MEKNTSTNTSHNRERSGVDHHRSLLRTATHSPETRSSSAAVAAATTSPEFVLQCWNRKRLRCMKIQAKDGGHGGDLTASGHRTTVRIDRRVVRSDANNQSAAAAVANSNNHHVYLNLRQRPSSPPHRVLRNSESSIGMRGHSNGVRGLASPDRGGGAQDKRGGAAHHNDAGAANDNHRHNNGNVHGVAGRSVSSEAAVAADGKKGGGSSSGSDAIVAAWPLKFVIALTNKEKEEDFFVFKGTKLPQRPKKRAKFIQRTLNLISPGAWLGDLSLERYEVREKKISKKRPRGLKAMGNVDSDSE